MCLKISVHLHQLCKDLSAKGRGEKQTLVLSITKVGTYSHSTKYLARYFTPYPEKKNKRLLLELIFLTFSTHLPVMEESTDN